MIESRANERRYADRPIPDEVLYPYPDPEVLGLRMDPEEMATVERVATLMSDPAFQTGLELPDLSHPTVVAHDVDGAVHHLVLRYEYVGVELDPRSAQIARERLAGTTGRVVSGTPDAARPASDPAGWVMWTPTAASIQAYSTPITPPPTTMNVLGIAGICSS